MYVSSVRMLHASLGRYLYLYMCQMVRLPISAVGSAWRRPFSHIQSATAPARRCLYIEVLVVRRPQSFWPASRRRGTRRSAALEQHKQRPIRTVRCCKAIERHELADHDPA